MRPDSSATAIAMFTFSLYTMASPAGVREENMMGCWASATPTALARSAVMVTPLGFTFLYSASSSSVHMDMAMRDTGTWWRASCSSRRQPACR